MQVVKPNDVKFCLLSNGKELGVYLFFDAYSEKDAVMLRHIGFLLLEQALGECDVATKVVPIHSPVTIIRQVWPETGREWDAARRMLELPSNCGVDHT